MAITFTKQPDSTKLIPAFNNQVFEFSSSTVTSPTHCLITNNVNSFVLKIYPNPSGVFWVNLKDLSKTFFEFKDADTFTSNPCVTSSYATVTFNFAIYNDSTNDNTNKVYNVFRYVIQDLESEKTKGLERWSEKYTYFKGFPFDITFSAFEEYNFDFSGIVNEEIKDYGVIRLQLDNGEGLLNLGVNNNLFYNKNSVIIKDTAFKIIDCDGIYLKWLASDGSWRYWLFNQKYKETINTKSLGQMDNDWNNPSENNAPIIEFGKSAENKIKLHSGDLDDYENEHLATLITAPKVYLYKGTKGVAGTLADWYEVELLTNSFITSDYGRKEKYVSFEIGHRINTMSLT